MMLETGINVMPDFHFTGEKIKTANWQLFWQMSVEFENEPLIS